MPFSAFNVVQHLMGRDAGVTLADRLNALFNQVLSKDEKTKYRLRELGDCSIGFALRGSSLRVVVEVLDGDIRAIRDQDLSPDVQIEGSLSDFIAMARSQREGSAMAAGKVSIQGDLATAQNVQAIIAEIDFDIEEIISERVGDVVARQMGRAVRAGLKWAENSHNTVERDVSEFLQFEARILPNEREMEEFIRSGGVAAMDVERLQARLERIQRKRAQK
jgi:ubiquinone biosynthesis protein UbiJ